VQTRCVFSSREPSSKSHSAGYSTIWASSDSARVSHPKEFTRSAADRLRLEYGIRALNKMHQLQEALDYISHHYTSTNEQGLRDIEMWAQRETENFLSRATLCSADAETVVRVSVQYGVEWIFAKSVSPRNPRYDVDEH